MPRKRHVFKLSRASREAREQEQIERAQDYLDEKAFAADELLEAVRFARERFLRGMSRTTAIALAAEHFGVAATAIEIELRK